MKIITYYTYKLYLYLLIYMTDSKKKVSYEIDGYILLYPNYRLIKDGDYDKNIKIYNTKVTDKKVIKLYYFSEKSIYDSVVGDDLIILKEYKKIKSSNGFTVEKIMDLILDSYDELQKIFGDIILMDSSLVGFTFNSKKLSIYPKTQS